MAVADVLKNWFLKLDELWAWVTPLLPDFSLSPIEKQAVLDWVARYVTQAPEDFSESWRDGILLCELADKFSPDLFHGHGILDPKNCLHNVSLALEIIKGSFDIDPDVTPEDIVICTPAAESKLFNLLLKLKERVESDKTEDVVSLSEASSDDDESPDSTLNDSFAQGAGLVIGFVGRQASFIVFSNGSLSDPDLVVEIKGPADTYYCEHITRRSPKRKSALPQSGTPPPTISHCGRSQSQTDLWAVENTSKKDPKMIPMAYQINDDFISIGYIPLKTGLHTITIIWRGRYVTGSPFVAMVEDSLKVQGKTSVIMKPSILRKEEPETALGPRRHSVRFKEPETHKVKLSNVRSRRVLRYIVKIGKKDVVIEAESSEMLAPALQKLDIPDEGTTPGPRRNSWGFVGDIHSQRRRSLMRQVGIDDSEEDLHREQRSFSLDISLAADEEECDATVSSAYPPERSLVNSVGHEYTSSDISSSDLSMENNSISTKQPRLETVSEPSSSLTSDMCAETDDKISTSEDEVFYKEHTSLSATPKLTTHSVVLGHFTSEIFCEINASGSEEFKTQQMDKPDNLSSRTEAQDIKRPLYSAAVEGKLLDKMQGKSDSLKNVRHDKIADEGFTNDELRIENTFKIESAVTVCAPKDSENLPNLPLKEDNISASRKHAVFETIPENYTQSNQEPNENLKVHFDVFDDKAKKIHTSHTFLTIGNKMPINEVNVLKAHDQTTNEDDEYYDRKTALLSPSKRFNIDDVIRRDNQSLPLKDDIDVMVNGSDVLCTPFTKEWSAENIVGHPQYCDTHDFENVSTKRNISDKTIAPEKWYVSKVVTSINRTNTGHNEERAVSDCNSDLNGKDQNFSGVLRWENFQEKYNEKEMPMMTLLSESEQRGSQLMSEPEHTTEAQDCFSLSTKPTKSESRMKFGKTRRILSHPYLKSTFHKTESANLSQNPYNSGERDAKHLRLEDISEGESPCLPEMRKHYENNVFENGSGNSTEPQECRDVFTWPISFANSSKTSVPQSECNCPESNARSFEKDQSTSNEVSVPTPITGESLKFSLRSYKDKHRSEYEEEIVPSNLVKDIVKDFHSRSLEYPAPRSDKSNDIYLRRSFFPTLASNEGRKTVKNRISKWEKSLSMPDTEDLAPESNKSSIRDKLSLYVNVQSKVAFWESAYHTPEGCDVPDRDNPDLSSSVYAENGGLELKDVSEELQQVHTGFDSMRDSDNPAHWESQPHRDSSHPVTSEQTEDSGISDDLLMCLKTSDHQRPPMLFRHRSLSDPCFRTISTGPADFLSNFEENLNIIPSSLYCSSEEKSEEALRESEDGNDEYIDDEIPDYAAMFLGDYISFTGLLGPERSSLRKEAVTQYLQKLEDKSRHIFDPSLSRPHECRALGVGIHYGLVSINNHFQVLTKDAGRGNLSVSIQGSGRHDVTKIIITYARNDVYDVIYQVLEPGYYIISIRWSDWSIPGSPFICKVTY